ncbi:hypothetical protein [Falsiroseomonas sp.]|uniref:hypothetical protein n=1 Tax=Falsiroseomonas sp. TaxID=2870721 RepID=UPI003F6F1F2F
MRVLVGAAVAVMMAAGGAAAQEAGPVRVVVEQRAEDGSFAEIGTLRCPLPAPCLAPARMRAGGQELDTLLAVGRVSGALLVHIVPDLPGRAVRTLTDPHEPAAMRVIIGPAGRGARTATLYWLEQPGGAPAHNLVARPPGPPMGVFRVTSTPD